MFKSLKIIIIKELTAMNDNTDSTIFMGGSNNSAQQCQQLRSLQMTYSKSMLGTEIFRNKRLDE